MRKTLLLLTASLVAGLAADAQANERHFTYTYESATLPEGVVELEPWTTWRVGRDGFYNRLDHRIELEIGLTDRLQTAFYLNFTALTADEAGVRTTELEHEGVSSEWKYRMLDPVADALGLALYGEVTLAPAEFELEAKVIADKRMGNLLFAGNLVTEAEMEMAEINATETEYIVEVDLAAGYFLSERTVVGLEIRNHTEMPEGSFEHTAFFAGPVVSYAASGWWVAATVLPQLFAVTDAEPSDFRDLAEHEKLNARILLGFHL
jgi:hypothetical protein